MFRHSQGRTTSLARFLAVALSAVAFVFDGGFLFAQASQAEPEANPDFSQQMKAKGAGGPVGEAEPSAAEAGAEEKMTETPAPVAKRASRPALAALDTRVTVRVKGAPLATFLDAISAQAKVNFIITEGLEDKRVTAFLQNVTVREALQVLLEIKGLTYQQIGKSSTYIVTKRSKEAVNLVTHIYSLSYIPLIPLSGVDSGDSSSARQSSGGISAGASASAGGAGSSGGAAAGEGGGGAKPCSAKNQKVSIARILCSVLSDHGDIELEPRTNSLIVTDIPESFPQVEQILADLDKKAPQVMIEAQIVEIDSNRARDLGFEWGGANGELGTFTGGSRDTSFPLNMPKHLSNLHFFDPLNPAGGIISSLGSAGGGASSGGGAGSSGSSGSSAIGSALAITQTGFLKTSVLDLSQLAITLRALVQRSEGRFLGKPKIMTLNNKTARIEITSDEAVAVQTNQSSAGGSVGLQTTSAERHQTGVVLKVTPQVNKEGYITMLLEPSFTDVQQAAISTASNPIFNPVKREAATLVRVKNGQTLVLGGLLRSVENKVVRKVPFLGYIPIIGWLFTNVSSRHQNTDLVIFITPTIVSD